MKEDKKGIGLKYALNGLKEVLIHEKNFRIHLIFAFIAIILGFLVQINKYEWLTIIITIHFVLVAELINSLFERIIDYVKPEYHPQAKIIKDIGAGIVLITASMSIIIALIIFLPKFF